MAPRQFKFSIMKEKKQLSKKEKEDWSNFITVVWGVLAYHKA